MHDTMTAPARPDTNLEWLLTNGIGGFAMGTASGINTRRYHGLLVASVTPPVNRVVCLHSTIDQYHPTGNEDDYIPLSTQCFGDEALLAPAGWRSLEDFSCDGVQATWTFRCGETTIRRVLQLSRGENACTIEWTVENAPVGGMLSIRPLAVMRDFHHLLTWWPHDIQSTAEGRRLCVRGNDMSIMLEANGGEWQAMSDWWHNFEYSIDRTRSMDHHEHAFCGGVLRVPMPTQGTIVRVHTAFQEAHANTESPRTLNRDNTTESRLARACDQFIVTRSRGIDTPSSVIAGYPWFADWGRDSFISLPGLFLKHGRCPEALSMLQGFASRMRRGIVPNRFDDVKDEAYYNTADASLWFINAVWACFEQAGGLGGHAMMAELVTACEEIIHQYRVGTDYGIGIDLDGLLMAGVPGEAVTWMDARVNGVGVTDRIGKPVELTALWHNALVALSNMAPDKGRAAEYATSAAMTCKAFNDRFWDESAGCCFDVLTPANGNWRGDHSIRPNQLLAMSLPFPLLSGERARSVHDTVRAHLLTPFGLRTLSPEDAGYHGRYEGDMTNRDRAYHNGTVWPWLLGPFCDGVRQLAQDAAAADAEIRDLLTPLIESMDAGCLGQICEIYDGDAPHDPQGCPAQAWSIAEVARSWPLGADLSTAHSCDEASNTNP